MNSRKKIKNEKEVKSELKKIETASGQTAANGLGNRKFNFINFSKIHNSVSIMNARKFLPYIAAVGVPTVAAAGGIGIVDAYQAITGGSMISIVELYRSMPTWAQIVAPIEVGTLCGLLGYTSKKAVEVLLNNKS